MLVAVALVVGSAVLLPDRDGLPDLDPVGGARSDLILDLFAAHVVGISFSFLIDSPHCVFKIDSAISSLGA